MLRKSYMICVLGQDAQNPFTVSEQIDIPCTIERHLIKSLHNQYHHSVHTHRDLVSWCLDLVYLETSKKNAHLL